MRASQAKIAAKAGLDRTTVSKILNRHPGDRSSPETVRRVFRIARRLGYDFSKIKHTERRRARRGTVRIPCSVAVEHDGRRFTSGRCTLTNLSASGAMLEELRLGRPEIPLGSFSVKCVPSRGPLVGVCISGEAVRVELNGGAALAVSFKGLSRSAAKKIKGLI
jgi:transcriptional regulator with XRE-family HTH domain